MIADGHLIFFTGLYEYVHVWVNNITPEGTTPRKTLTLIVDSNFLDISISIDIPIDGFLCGYMQSGHWSSRLQIQYLQSVVWMYDEGIGKPHMFMSETRAKYWQ